MSQSDYIALTAFSSGGPCWVRKSEICVILGCKERTEVYTNVVSPRHSKITLLDNSYLLVYESVAEIATALFAPPPR